MAFDEGAASILKDPLQPGVDGAWTTVQVPREVLDFLESGEASDSPSRKLRFHVGTRNYVCRVHTVQSGVAGFSGRFVVLHISRDVTITDALALIAAEYRLTSREKEALEGIMQGLSSKEVAVRMNISPNTVKAFLRLVMGKMGVTSRAGIVTKLFDHNGHGQ